jgi:regulator of replication initiation timing
MYIQSERLERLEKSEEALKNRIKKVIARNSELEAANADLQKELGVFHEMMTHSSIDSVKETSQSNEVRSNHKTLCCLKKK